MQFSRLFFCVAFLLAPVAIFGTTWLYLYPFFDRACSFPTPPDSSHAPFRLLALGDPQLEGDSSLPRRGAPIFPSLDFVYENVSSAVQAGNYTQGWHLVRTRLEEGLVGKLGNEGVKWAWRKRKWIDLWGNDWYLAHIARTLRWWTAPTHVAVLGDLLGSQWIKDEEFERRSKRYWDVVFRGMGGVPEYIMTGKEEDAEGGEEVTQQEKKWGGTREVLGADERWKNRVINIAGNHDIGYAGDIDEARIERFERSFGRVNWDIVFTLPNTSSPSTSLADDQPSPPELRLVILNSMNLDTPCWAPSLQQESYDFMNHIVATARPVTDKTHATVLLTHIPFHKEAGVCVDAPLFTFFEGGSGVKEQNMLSEYVSKMLLESIFGLSGNTEAAGRGFGRRGIVINGHDHAGCDVLHWIEQPGVAYQCPESTYPNIDFARLPDSPADFSDTTAASVNATSETDIDTVSAAQEPSPSDSEPPKFQAVRFPHPPYTTSSNKSSCVSLGDTPHLREITLRSMMGDYAGYAGFLSAWFDPALGERGEWKLEFNTCGLGTQHWWWGLHVVDLILFVALVGGFVARGVEKSSGTVAAGSQGDAVRKDQRKD